MRTRVHLRLPLLGIAALALVTSATVGVGAEPPGQDTGGRTPIQHLVVIYQENVSFDHYFGTYPFALNPAGEPQFVASRETPTVNGLCTATGPYLLAPNAAPCDQNEPLLNGNNPNTVQPFRLDNKNYETCSQGHGYTAEQQAYDSGLADKFVEFTGHCRASDLTPAPDVAGASIPGSQVMGYYDGNTVTALWNYAQSFAMNDNSFSTNFGPSTVGAINLISGQTSGFTPALNSADTNNYFFDTSESGTIIGDPQPTGDICDTRDSSTSLASGRNIGDLLNAKGVSWGWFEGGFREAPGAATCTVSHTNKGGVVSKDYIPHHEPFQYYESTQNLQHLPPTDLIGKTDQANHQYDLTDFWAAVDAHSMPAVNFLKAPAYQDGHAGYSDPLDEQQFVVSTINRLEKTPYWNSTAVVIAYDDSDGWYDHVMPPIVNQSQDSKHDALRHASTGALGDCGTSNNPNATNLPTQQDRCGYGPRQPLLVISPFAKSNFVDHSLTNQGSILRFIEDNWSAGRIGNGSMDTKSGTILNMFQFPPIGPLTGNNKLFLDPDTGLRSGPQ